MEKKIATLSAKPVTLVCNLLSYGGKVTLLLLTMLSSVGMFLYLHAIISPSPPDSRRHVGPAADLRAAPAPALRAAAHDVIRAAVGAAPAQPDRRAAPAQHQLGELSVVVLSS